MADTDYSNFNCPDAVLKMAFDMRKIASDTPIVNTIDGTKVCLCYLCSHLLTATFCTNFVLCRFPPLVIKLYLAEYSFITEGECSD